MDKPHIFTAAAAEAPYKHILFRMGYRDGMTEMEQAQKSRIDSDILRARAMCDVKTAYLKVKITSAVPGGVILENGIELKSNLLAQLLEGCAETVLMAATAGQAVVDSRDKEMSLGNASFSLIIDAVASETADAGLDWMQNYADKLLSKEGLELTRRYSPGYGDLDLSAQKPIFDALELHRIGMSINERFILTPEKSVIAVAGVKVKR